jgi:hypothetical protein
MEPLALGALTSFLPSFLIDALPPQSVEKDASLGCPRRQRCDHDYDADVEPGLSDVDTILLA